MTDHAPLLERAFAVEPLEASYVPSRVDGALPSFLRGTYYVNGPARFSNGPVRYRHWLDGDGMVCAVRFGEFDINVTSRYVKSEKWQIEHAAARPVFRAFGTSFPQDTLVRGIALMSPVNISVYSIAGRLLAFGEQGLPWQLDSATLETIGRFTFNGGINELTPFSAHPKLDLRDGTLCNFGVSFSPSQPCLHYYEFSGGNVLRSRHRVPLEYASSLHDFALSPSFATFYVSPFILDMATLAHNGGTPLEALRWMPDRPSRLLIIDRANGKPAALIPISGRGSVGESAARYSLHTINSFEEDDYLYVDVIELERPVYDQYQPVPDLFIDVPLGWPTRFVIDCRNFELVERRRLAYEFAPDFPSIDPSRAAHSYDDFWVLGISKARLHGRKFFDELVHLNWTAGGVVGSYRAPARCYLGGEPIFVPSPGDGGQGIIVCQEFDATESTMSLLIFDAFCVQRGPFARLRFDVFLPFGFHASFDAARIAA